jgi:hypothetical protein
MRFVKGNNSLFIIGENCITQSLSQLSEFGQNLNPITLSSLETDKFTYNLGVNKNIRLHSRKTKCILECMNYLNFAKLKKEYKSERIGIYINGSHNVLDFEFPSFTGTENTLYEIYRKNITPTYNVKNILGILPGHVAIYHEIHGPTFVISSLEKNQILNKARIDLQTQMIDLAIIGFVNTYEDPMTLAWHSNKANGKKIIEAAGVVLLTKNDDISFDINEDRDNYYGYLDGLIS